MSYERISRLVRGESFPSFSVKDESRQRGCSATNMRDLSVVCGKRRMHRPYPAAIYFVLVAFFEVVR